MQVQVCVDFCTRGNVSPARVDRTIGWLTCNRTHARKQSNVDCAIVFGVVVVEKPKANFSDLSVRWRGGGAS